MDSEQARDAGYVELATETEAANGGTGMHSLRRSSRGEEVSCLASMFFFFFLADLDFAWCRVRCSSRLGMTMRVRRRGDIVLGWIEGDLLRRTRRSYSYG